MRRWGPRLVWLLVSVLALPLPLSGATFEMKNGDVIVGELAGPIKVEPAFGGELNVPAEEIMSIEGDRFAFQDGTVLKGRIKQETLSVKTRYGLMPLPVSQIKFIRWGK